MRNIAEAYFELAELCIANMILPNLAAQARAKGMYEALEVMRTVDATLPVASLTGLRSLRGCAGSCPSRHSPLPDMPHHLQLILGFDSVLKFQSHRLGATQADKFLPERE